MTPDQTLINGKRTDAATHTEGFHLVAALIHNLKKKKKRNPINSLTKVQKIGPDQLSFFFPASLDPTRHTHTHAHTLTQRYTTDKSFGIPAELSVL